MASYNPHSDPERIEKMNKISELLTAAGYARARIPSLSDLDKILGGITWGLTSCFYDVEFEFKDEMSLGEKVRVSEKITKALKNAKCPYSINPVQLQGLDVNSIFTVIQWLVKLLHENRDERNQLSKKIATSYCGINIIKKSSNKEQVDQEASRYGAAVNKVKYEILSEGRQLRALGIKSNLQYNEELRVYFTLMEYGIKKDLNFQKSLLDLLKKKNMIHTTSDDSQSTRGKSTTVTSKSAKPTYDPLTGGEAPKSKIEESASKFQQVQAPANEISESEIKEMDALLNNNGLEAIKNDSLKIEASIIEEIFSNNMEQVLSEIQKYEQLEKNEKFDSIKLIIKEKERLQNIKKNIEQQTVLYEAENEKLNEDLAYLDGRFKQAAAHIEKSRSEFENNEVQLNKLEEKIKTSAYATNDFLEISGKIEKRENLKDEINKFKTFCKEEKDKLELLFEATEKRKLKMNSEENQQAFEEIDVNYNVEVSKLLQKKQALFDENKIINLLTRKIQVNPSKLELVQYQKRFEELYEQINLVNEKNRELINEINSKEEVKMLLQQKLDTFVQLKTFYKDLKSKKEKESFKASLDGVQSGVADSATRSGNRLNQLHKDLEQAKNDFVQKQEYEQNYMKLVKEYNREYNKLYSK